MLVSCEEMTPEEYKKYIDEHTHTYEVVSVIQYISTETNRFGGVESESLKYCFTYIGDDGKLHQVDDFEHTEHGLWKVCVGNKNKYVIDDSRIDTYKTLYLTRETFAEIQANSKSIERSD
jgi:hypothetical protein